MDLVKQLEDKKKGFEECKNCGLATSVYSVKTHKYLRCGEISRKGNMAMCPKHSKKFKYQHIHYETFQLLEQAIAEMKSKENEFKELLNEEIGKNYQEGFEDCEKIAKAEMQKIRDTAKVRILRFCKMGQSQDTNYYMNKAEALQEFFVITDEELTEIKNIQSQQNKTSEGGVQFSTSGNTYSSEDKTTDKPQQEKIGEGYAKSSEMGSLGESVSLANSPVVSNLLQKQRQEEIDFLKEFDWTLKDLKFNGHQELIKDEKEGCFTCSKIRKAEAEISDRIQQLNQPKTED